MRLLFCFILGLMLLAGCAPADRKKGSEAPPLFTLLSPDSTHVDFANTLHEGLNTNVLMYEYFYNGAGVAIADLNGDGLQDIYFTGNMAPNKLYLNKGHLQFEDITAAAGVQSRTAPWRTGVTIADVNGDARPDLFVSYSGKVRGSNRMGQLFINEGADAGGVPHFSEQAAQYGLADSFYATQTYFFDYDRDGDLDALFLNHNPANLPVLDEASTAALLAQEDKTIGVRLYQNNNNHFSDVTAKSGISSSVLTYGLGAGISDLNGDGWPDVYIANDYNVPDYLYINNGNGTFSNKLQSMVQHISKSSMGNNISDINNDGKPDIFVLDMLPASNRRQKLLFASDNYEKFQMSLRSGFYYQYMRNMLQLNNGDGSFSEVGQLAGLSGTDWSWAPLFADFDNDGWKDLFVTNGYTRDFTNMDFLKYMNDYIQVRGRLKREDVLSLLQQMPASDVINYAFKNNGNLSFTDVSQAWGMRTPSNSNGAAYADLDNDGDLDLVVNNINQPAFIYRNEANHSSANHFLNIRLHGLLKNTDGLGAKVFLFQKGSEQFLEQMPARGFQSTVSPVLHFGLGTQGIDSLKIVWQSGFSQTLTAVKANTLLDVFEKEATPTPLQPAPAKPLFTEIESPVTYTAARTTTNDFKRQPLLINPLSFSTPCLAKADVNGDGLDDVFVGGGAGQAGALFLQQKGGAFLKKGTPVFEKDKSCEDAGALFFDADNNGTPDLYVVSGGYGNYEPDDALLQDRLYLNDGRGNFTASAGALPPMHVSKSCARAADINGDGALDLFVGGRVVPGRYPETPQSFILINNGHGHFTDETAQRAAALQHIGMVTDAAWVDLNNDAKKELVLVGEWLPVTVFENANGTLQNKTKNFFDSSYSGWWNNLTVADINSDGRPDLIAGNLGLNTQCRASAAEPAEIVYKDFDDNGSVDPMFCFYMQGTSYPFVTRDELLDQMSNMRARFINYKSYADATLDSVFTADELKDARHLQANFFETACFVSSAGGHLRPVPLPVQAQFAPVFTTTVFDYNGDGKSDLLLCGNINQARLRFGKYDANRGVLLQGDGSGRFRYVPQTESGFKLTGDVRSVLPLNHTLLFGINQQPLKAYRWH